MSGFAEFLEARLHFNGRKPSLDRWKMVLNAQELIVELHGSPEPSSDNPWLACKECQGIWPCDTLKLLALPYADHPDYVKAWRP